MVSASEIFEVEDCRMVIRESASAAELALPFNGAVQWRILK